ncbi:ABC transporter substrate-binding protein [Magnetococcus sp. PR-3]|uniref:ABC transporter substrate-binding protein n=1 Tax=Magnetococcus sp. PR-3 TaxID=3120355 RepID=UPI002FCE4DD8
MPDQTPLSPLHMLQAKCGSLAALLWIGLFTLLTTAEPVHSETLHIGCTAWGCQSFEKTANQWANPQGHTVKLYEGGRLSDNLLGLYRQILAAQSSDFDLILMDTIWPGVLGKHLVDLREYIPEQNINQHFKPIIANLTDAQGHLLALPLFTDAGLLFYRKDLLEKHGFEPPQTWQQMAHIAREIVRLEQPNHPELAGYLWQGKAYEGLTCNALEWVDSHHGGTIVDDATGQVTINNPQAIKALQMARDWIGAISPKSVLHDTEMENTEQFRAGHAVFMRNWMEIWARINDEHSPIRGKVGVIPLPKGGETGKHSGTLGDMSLAVSRYSENIELSARLVQQLTDYAPQKMHAMRHSFSPTIETLYDDAIIKQERPFMGALKTALLNGVARPAKRTARAYPKVSRKFHKAVHSILSGKQKAADALAQLEQELNALRRTEKW